MVRRCSSSFAPNKKLSDLPLADRVGHSSWPLKVVRQDLVEVPDVLVFGHVGHNLTGDDLSLLVGQGYGHKPFAELQLLTHPSRASAISRRLVISGREAERFRHGGEGVAGDAYAALGVQEVWEQRRPNFPLRRRS